MLIKLSRVFEYDDTGWNCQEKRLLEPTWNALESAVRRLNKFQFPFIWFFLSKDAADDALPDFSIMGGEGDYVMSTFDSERIDRHIRFPSHSDKRIDVWLSDQGCDFEEQFVCHDIDFVLDVLRRYADSGQFPSDILWE